MSDNLSPVVTGVATEDNRNVTFTFEDGHRLIIEGYFRGEDWPVEDLFRVRMFNGDDLVMVYNFLGTSDEDEHRFIDVADGYTHERIAAYWWATYEHTGEKYVARPRIEGREAPPELRLPWKLSCKMNRDFALVRDGVKEFPQRVQEWPVRECIVHGLISVDVVDLTRCPAPALTGEGLCDNKLSEPFIVVRQK